MEIRTVVAGLMLALTASAWAAINPAEYQRAATDALRIRETARVVQETTVDGARLRRVTLVGEVIEQAKARGPMVGKTVVIDYTVDLALRERAGREHAARQGRMPGPQFMHAPDPPVLDEAGAYWANLAPANGHANPHAGAVAGAPSTAISGEVYVPAAGQYSFDPPPR